MERLARLSEALLTVVIGTLAPACVQALTSWWNRDTAKTNLEAERLRREKDGDGETVT